MLNEKERGEDGRKEGREEGREERKKEREGRQKKEETTHIHTIKAKGK